MTHKHSAEHAHTQKVVGFDRESLQKLREMARGTRNQREAITKYSRKEGEVGKT